MGRQSQVKRLRRAQSAYIHDNRTSLARGEPVHLAAERRAQVIIENPAPTHRARGEIGARLRHGNLIQAAILASMLGGR